MNFRPSGEGDAADDDDDQHHEQSGHTDGVEALNAVLNATLDDQQTDAQEQNGEHHAAKLVGQHGSKQLTAGFLGNTERQIAEVQGHVFQAVAAQNGVEAHDQEGRQDAQPAQEAELLGDGIVGTHDAGAGLTADGQLTHHDDKANEQG